MEFYSTRKCHFLFKNLCTVHAALSNVALLLKVSKISYLEIKPIIGTIMTYKNRTLYYMYILAFSKQCFYCDIITLEQAFCVVNHITEL